MLALIRLHPHVIISTSPQGSVIQFHLIASYITTIDTQAGLMELTLIGTQFALNISNDGGNTWSHLTTQFKPAVAVFIPQTLRALLLMRQTKVST